MAKTSVRGIAIFLCVLAGGFVSAVDALRGGKSLPVPRELWVMRRAYPDVLFSATYDFLQFDWRIDVTAPVFPNQKDKKHATFYWADGALLPETELPHRKNYWTLLYHYAEELKDPATMSEEEIERMRQFGSRDNRRNGAGTPMFFFEFLYAAKSRVIIEDHIKSVLLWGKKTKVHERILPALRRVESRVNALAQTDREVAAFLVELKSADAYY